MTKRTKPILYDLLDAIEPDHPVTDIRTCIHLTAVQSRCCGLASSVFPLGSPHPVIERAGDLAPCAAGELAQMVLSANSMEASIGMAAINSSLPADDLRLQDLSAEQEIMNLGRGKAIAVIGHFPFTGRLRNWGEAKKLMVFERAGRQQFGDLPEQDMKEMLAQADLVAITGTTLCNHTLGEILELARPDAVKIMLGPSTPLSPVMFDYGFRTLFGALVIDVDRTMTEICQGANFRQLKNIRKVALTA